MSTNTTGTKVQFEQNGRTGTIHFEGNELWITYADGLELQIRRQPEDCIVVHGWIDQMPTGLMRVYRGCES